MRGHFGDIGIHSLYTERHLVRIFHGIYSFFGLYRCVQCNSSVCMICYTCSQHLRYSVPDSNHCSSSQSVSTCDGIHLSIFSYTKVVKSLFAVYKFQEAFQYQRLIEQLMSNYAQLDPFRVFASLINTLLSLDGVIVLVPVPMTKRKRQKRGFSPANEITIMIGRILAEKAHKTVLIVDSLVTKIKETQAQSKKKRRERLLSIYQSFSVNDSVFEALVNLSPAALIIVDDVYTTGATITELRECLVRAGLKIRLPNTALLSFSFARAERL